MEGFLMNTPKSEFKIGEKTVGLDHPTYFIADIAANHDGDIGRAKELIHLAAEAGADAAKFQHFQAETIVSDVGFRAMSKESMSHQASWKKSVFEVYKEASVDPGWTPILKETCDKAGITFFTTPYSFELCDVVDPFVPAYKIGSGDVTWPQYIEYVAGKGKPMILACGAANFEDTDRAVRAALANNDRVALLQCNTNYTASLENFKYIQLNVLKSFANMYPGMVLGLSDHTPGHATVLGAVALGGRIVEKHFTDDITRTGPDHKFSMDPRTWRDMVDRTRELENALGGGIKKIEDNEKDTVVVQRRGLRAARDLAPGEVLKSSDLVALRPCPLDGFPPSMEPALLGKTTRVAIKKGEHLTWSLLA
jgi:N-acetylneuraminate synthase